MRVSAASNANTYDHTTPTASLRLKLTSSLDRPSFGDGGAFVDVKRLKEILGKYDVGDGRPGILTRSDVVRLVAAYDKNGDGLASKKEVQTLVREVVRWAFRSAALNMIMDGKEALTIDQLCAKLKSVEPTINEYGYKLDF